MTKNLLVVICLLMPSILFAQKKTDKAEVTWGDEFKDSKTKTLSYTIGESNGSIYTLSYKLGGYLSSASYYISRFDSNMNQVDEMEIDLVVDGKSMDFNSAFFLNGKLYVSANLRDNKSKYNKLFVQQIDLGNLNLVGKAKELASINFDGNFKWNAGDFNFVHSEDSSKILLYYNLPFEKKRKGEIWIPCDG